MDISKVAYVVLPETTPSGQNAITPSASNLANACLQQGYATQLCLPSSPSGGWDQPEEHDSLFVGPDGTRVSYSSIEGGHQLPQAMQTSEAGGFILSLKSQIAGEQEDDADPNVLSFVSLDDFKKKIGGCTAMSDAQKEVLIDHVAKHCMPMPGEVAYCPGTLEPPCPSGPPVVG